MYRKLTILIPVFCVLLPLVAQAEAPVVVDAQASGGGDIWTISVTLSHPDTGWDHYADGWQVLDSNENIIGFRTLAHPHVNEQPFTRSLSGVIIPADHNFVLIRARDNIGNWSAETFKIEISK